MSDERRRALRFPFTAAAEIIEPQTDTRIEARTSDISLAGCYFDMLNPLPLGTEVRLQITHDAANFTALGIVIHSESSMGMGIGFTSVDPGQLQTLEKWIDQAVGNDS